MQGVIDRLSGLPNLKIISRTSAFRYKQRDIEPKKVAKELGVEALVTGRVIQRGDDLSVSAELVEAASPKSPPCRPQRSRKLLCRFRPPLYVVGSTFSPEAAEA
jgi:TolB-like protein